MTTVLEILRSLPAVGQLLETPPIAALLERHPRALVVGEIQLQLEQLRQQIQAGFVGAAELETTLDGLPEKVVRELGQRLAASLRPVVNATGVLIHTNAGRAPLSHGTVQAMSRLASGYSNLEYDLSRRGRGSRDQHFEGRIVRLLGCQAATVCNNNAAALFLILNTLAVGRRVLVSRGELVEIGGSFRIPEILAASGAVLREVGTTNKTRLSDYRNALDEGTALILKVHASNFRIVGFTEQAHTGELAELARQANIPLVEDVGSGLLFDDDHPSLRREPSVVSTLSAGADLVCFSGDKLLGGPQAGVITGRKGLIRRIRKNPLMRALRVDKTTYAALEHVLTEYEQGDWRNTIPIHRMLRVGRESIQQRALVLAERLVGTSLRSELVEGASLSGGGSAPEEHIPTWLLALRHRDLSANQLEERLRLGDPPILVRIEEDQVRLDLRTVFPEEDAMVAEALRHLAG